MKEDYSDDYENNYMRKRYGSGFWIVILIYVAIGFLLWLADSIFSLNIF